MNYPRVSIIILNWNGWKDTIECLESLYKINYQNYDVIVVDNNSKDESIEKVKEYCEGKIKQILPEFVALRSAPIEVNSKFFKYNSDNKPIKVFEINEEEARNGKFLYKEEYEKLEPNRRMVLIKNKDNYGYAGGNNVGIKFALSVLNPDYVLLLNNDTVVDKDFLIEMVKVAESDDKIGIVGSKIYYYDYNGRSDVIWLMGGGSINLLTGGHKSYYEKKIDNQIEYDNTLLCDYITGCSMLIKREILEKIGGLNEYLYLYYEDAELCYEAKQIGYTCVCATKSKLWHKVSTTSNTIKGTQLYYFTRNRILFMRKWAGELNKYVFIIGSIILLPIVLLREVFKGRYQYIKYILKGFYDGYASHIL